MLHVIIPHNLQSDWKLFLNIRWQICKYVNKVQDYLPIVRFLFICKSRHVLKANWLDFSSFINVNIWKLIKLQVFRWMNTYLTNKSLNIIGHLSYERMFTKVLRCCLISHWKFKYYSFLLVIIICKTRIYADKNKYFPFLCQQLCAG